MVRGNFIRGVFHSYRIPTYLSDINFENGLVDSADGVEYTSTKPTAFQINSNGINGSKAIQFTTNSAGITRSIPADALRNKNFSFETNIKMNTFRSINQGIILIRNGANDEVGQFCILTNPNSGQVILNPGTTNVWSNAGVLQLGVWHYYQVTVSNNVVRAYLDNNLVLTRTLTQQITAQTVCLGANKNLTQYWLDGLMDNVKLYTY